MDGVSLPSGLERSRRRARASHFIIHPDSGYRPASQPPPDVPAGTMPSGPRIAHEFYGVNRRREISGADTDLPLARSLALILEAPEGCALELSARLGFRLRLKFDFRDTPFALPSWISRLPRAFMRADCGPLKNVRGGVPATLESLRVGERGLAPLCWASFCSWFVIVSFFGGQDRLSVMSFGCNDNIVMLDGAVLWIIFCQHAHGLKSNSVLYIGNN